MYQCTEKGLVKANMMTNEKNEGNNFEGINEG